MNLKAPQRAQVIASHQTFPDRDFPSSSCIYPSVLLNIVAFLDGFYITLSPSVLFGVIVRYTLFPPVIEDTGQLGPWVS